LEKKKTNDIALAEKRDLKQANKIRTKLLSMTEMIVEFDSFFGDSVLHDAFNVVKGLPLDLISHRTRRRNSFKTPADSPIHPLY
jgi:hypothetical protein